MWCGRRRIAERGVASRTVRFVVVGRVAGVYQVLVYIRRSHAPSRCTTSERQRAYRRGIPNTWTYFGYRCNLNALVRGIDADGIIILRDVPTSNIYRLRPTTKRSIRRRQRCDRPTVVSCDNIIRVCIIYLYIYILYCKTWVNSCRDTVVHSDRLVGDRHTSKSNVRFQKD